MVEYSIFIQSRVELQKPRPLVSEVQPLISEVQPLISEVEQLLQRFGRVVVWSKGSGGQWKEVERAAPGRRDEVERRRGMQTNQCAFANWQVSRQWGTMNFKRLILLWSTNKMQFCTTVLHRRHCWRSTINYSFALHYLDRAGSGDHWSWDRWGATSCWRDSENEAWTNRCSSSPLTIVQFFSCAWP